MMNRQDSEISDDFLAQLKEDLVHRRVGRGMAGLDDQRHLLTSLDPEQKNAGRFAGYLAQWVDIGFQRPSLVKEIVARFTKPTRARLSLHDYMYLRLAEGMVAWLRRPPRRPSGILTLFSASKMKPAIRNCYR